MPQVDCMTRALDIRPRFEMESFMRLSNEFRLTGEIMRKIMQRWGNWLDAAHAIAQAAGFTRAAFFRERKPVFYDL